MRGTQGGIEYDSETLVLEDFAIAREAQQSDFGSSFSDLERINSHIHLCTLLLVCSLFFLTYIYHYELCFQLNDIC